MPSSMPAGILTSSVLVFLILPAPWQVVQGSGMILPVPWQCGQVCWMLKKPWRMRTVPWSRCTSRAGLGAGARLGAAALAGLAAFPGRDADLRVVAARGLLQRDLHAVAQVGAAIDLRAATLPRRPPPRLAEDVAEDVAEGLGETAEALAALRAAEALVRVDAGVAVLVVGGPLLAVREHLVGLLGLLELVLGLLVARIAVRVVFHRELAISLLDVVVAGVLRDAQNLVIITLRHGSSRGLRASNQNAARGWRPRAAAVLGQLSAVRAPT